MPETGNISDGSKLGDDAARAAAAAAATAAAATAAANPVDTNAAAAAAAAGGLFSIAIKAPQFMESAAAGWFAIIEAQFHLRNITISSTKFYHVLAALPPDVVVNLNSQILDNKNYEELKKAVISNYEKTKPELFEKLITNTKLTGRPSLYLQELLTVARKVGVGEELVKHRFIQSLPATIAPVIAAQHDLPLARLGSMADELIPLVQNTTANQVARTMDKQETSTASTVANKNSVPLGLKPFHANQKPQVCRGHLYYGAKSRSCKPWCKWPEKRDCNILPNSRPASPSPSEQGN